MNHQPEPGVAAPHRTSAGTGAQRLPTLTLRERSPGEGGVARIPSTRLLQGARTLEISHGLHVYRLQLTAAGKLILTK